MGQADSAPNELHRLFAKANTIFARIPPDLKLEVDEIAKSRHQFGPRLLNRGGPGLDFFDTPPFRKGQDVSLIDWRVSARLPVNSDGTSKFVRIEREAEVVQHVYFWRKAGGTAARKTRFSPLTPQEGSEFMLVAFAQHLAENGDLVGLIDGEGAWSGSNAAAHIAGQLCHRGVTGAMPKMTRELPPDSTVVLFSDFLDDPAEIAKGLGMIRGQELKGYLVRAVDPALIDFAYEGPVELTGGPGEATLILKKAESNGGEAREMLAAHTATLEAICKKRHFTLIQQRLDEPLENAILRIYKQNPKAAPAPDKKAASWFKIPSLRGRAP